MTTSFSIRSISLILVGLTTLSVFELKGQHLQRLRYNNPELIVDLGVGLGSWPMPMDYDNDGLVDLLVACADVPYDGIFFFKNTGEIDEKSRLPLFAAGKKITDARKYLRPEEKMDRAPNIRVSLVDDKPVILTPGIVYPDFELSAFSKPEGLPIGKRFHGLGLTDVRANQWEYVDFNGDGLLDLVIGLDTWSDYRSGTYDQHGQWMAGPLRGYVYIALNSGTNEEPLYKQPEKLKTTDGKTLEVFGWPSPVFADFTGSGKLDLICGEFIDGFTFFKNVGTRQAPLYARGVPLTYADRRLTMDLCMPVPVACDLNDDGWMDLIVGEEAGRIAFMEHTSEVIDGVPRFLPPKFFRQKANEVKFGVLATPVGVDWNGDGRQDIITGNSEGQVAFIENLGGNPVKWAPPQLLEAGGEAIRIMAGVNGSVQGPAEEKWGYTSPTVADWNGDGLLDLIVNSIWGKVIWYENTGTREIPKLAAAQSIKVEWDGLAPKPAWNWWNPVGNELVTQWRTTPVAVDWTGDGLIDLVMLDHEGYLALYRRKKVDNQLILLPGERIFRLLGEDGPLRLSNGQSGGSGRRKLSIADIDGDGRLDLLLNGDNAVFYRNVGEKEGIVTFRDEGLVADEVLAGHTTSPTTIDIDGDGQLEILIGAEDGFFYLLRESAITKKRSDE